MITPGPMAKRKINDELFENIKEDDSVEEFATQLYRNLCTSLKHNDIGQSKTDSADLTLIL